jgi:hypothetical protein
MTPEPKTSPARSGQGQPETSIFEFLKVET